MAEGYDMNALTPGHLTLDYQPCRYGGAKIAFRGPARRLKGKYITFLGGTETFGPFIQSPFPDLVDLQTGLTCINLGCRKGGIDSYLSAPSLIDMCSMARVTVIQVMGAQYMSNRFYSVDPRRNNRFLRASKLMKSIFFELDFTTIQTTDDLLTLVAEQASDRMQLLIHEMQCAWVARMRSLIRAIDGTTVLLWAADHAPFSTQSGGTICREPLFIDRAMLTAVMEEADHLVEVVITPHEVTDGFDMMHIGPTDIAAAVEMLGPVAHQRIATALGPMLMEIVQPTLADEDVNFFLDCAAG